MELLSRDEISKMSVTERTQLIAQLWDSLLGEDGSLPEAEKSELLRMLAGVVGEPSGRMTWERLKAELARRKEQSDKESRTGGPASRNLGGIIGPY